MDKNINKTQKYTLYVTPKTFNDILQSNELREKYKDFKIIPTHDIYMNKMDGWTEEECDNVVYAVPSDATMFQQPHLGVKL